MEGNNSYTVLSTCHISGIMPSVVCISSTPQDNHKEASQRTGDIAYTS